MYWPAGGPLAYAFPKKNKDDRSTPEDGNGNGTVHGNDRNPLINICASRNSQLIAAITETTLSIWQTHVSV